MDDQRTNREGGGVRSGGYSLQRLFVSVTLIAIGLGMAGYGSKLPDANWRWILFLVLGGGACIGAGVMTPFKLPWIGAVVGCLLTVAFVVLYIICVAIYLFFHTPHIT